MGFQERYVYHIKDEYFKKANDEKLMQNKEGGTYRPTFLCMKDTNNVGLLWVVPMSNKVEKFKAIRDKQIDRYGKSLTIVIGEFDGKEAVFLLQNMFPITARYLDHVHTRNGNPVPVKYSLFQEVRSNMKRIQQLIERGHQVVFPDINRLKFLMLEELHLSSPAVNTDLDKVPTRQPVRKILATSQFEADRRNSTRSLSPHDRDHGRDDKEK